MKKEIKRGRGKPFKKGMTPWNKGLKGTCKHTDTEKEIRRKRMIGNKIGIGTKNHWKGGITPLTNQIRNCPKYRQWRSDIFTRDNFTCILCSARCRKGFAVYIEADHYPKRFATILHESGVKNIEQALLYEEFWNINNGRTLCKKCHDKTKKGRIK